MAIPALKSPMGAWEKLQSEQYAHDPIMQKVLQAGLNKMNCYYFKIEKSNTYAIAMILTPTKYLRTWWKSIYQSAPFELDNRPLPKDADLWGNM
ncbi:hypothetical protein DACRYDRAFT_108933 [Dacryopinax primogenitus]|uniref:Uncharacterized protein n=1 Tax=Dacryopinax primogenitus (strain DJM 731) TaxID=1858805 RepID=M5G8V0_DACPD|nr:uncharacterized protein DACRYDRAFT_108933 [Dacryopinax primogenitus]EJU00183.1 hypothetical protein DACRYDRAFT_108933 [Dacryopinax primogenitus]